MAISKWIYEALSSCFFRHTADQKPQQATQQVVADARDRLRHGRSRPNIRSRLGLGLAHSMTPAPSMENLKVVLDVNERVSDHSWGSSGEEDEDETLVVQEDCDQEYDVDESSVDGVDLMADIRSDLRSRLNRRQPSPATMRPGFEPADSRPAFLQNLPSLQIEIREEMWSRGQWPLYHDHIVQWPFENYPKKCNELFVKRLFSFVKQFHCILAFMISLLQCKIYNNYTEMMPSWISLPHLIKAYYDYTE